MLLAAAMGFSSVAANASTYLDQCGAALTAQWRDKTAARPIDPSKHLPVVLVSIARSAPQESYQEAARGLAHAFSSFKEARGSRILTGCCSVPIFGSISFNDLAKLSTAKFASLCDVGQRGSSVQVRMEYREAFQRGIGAAPYFWISY